MSRKINRLTLNSEADRILLFQHSVLAFESLRYKDNLEALDKVSPENLEKFSELFTDLDDIEATLYYQIIRERINVIETMQKKVEENVLEKVMQELLYEHLWLLDPSWERATETPYMESTVQIEFKKIDAKLTDAEKAGRFDLKYKMTSGKNVIIELKRAERTTSSMELVTQTSKYRNALKKLLKASNREHEPIEVVCIVGKELTDWKEESGREESTKMLIQKNTRVVMYQELLENANRAYRAFLEKRKESGRIYNLIKRIGSDEPD